MVAWPDYWTKILKSYTGLCLKFALHSVVDKTLIMWKLTRDETNYGVPQKALRGHGHFVSDVVMSSDGQFALSGSWDGTLRLWDLSTYVICNTCNFRWYSLPDSKISFAHLFPHLNHKQLFCFLALCYNFSFLLVTVKCTIKIMKPITYSRISISTAHHPFSTHLGIFRDEECWSQAIYIPLGQESTIIIIKQTFVFFATKKNAHWST